MSVRHCGNLPTSLGEEKLVHHRLFEYLNKNEILTPKQGGFRPGHSTTLTATSFITQILDNANHGMFTASVFIDLRKAFDTIDHLILMKKLWAYGLKNTTHKWFESYLTNRMQRTMVNGTFSKFASSVCGVPQGSVLGPVLFLLYINDVVHVVGEEHIFLYADDTVLFVEGNDVNSAREALQGLLNRFVAWSHANKLTLNTQKTKTMSFLFPRGQDPDLMKLKVGDAVLGTASSYKYLGYLLDANLTYNDLMKSLIQKITYKLYLLAKLRPMLTRAAALAIYKTKILSYIDYNLLMYTSTRKQYQIKLQTLQNKAIRIILRLPRCTNVDSHHLSLKLWHIETRYRFFLLKFAYSIAHSHQDELLDRRNIPTRLHDGMPFSIPSRCSSKYMKSFIYVGKMSWNCLDPETQFLPTIESFSLHIRRMLNQDETSTYASEITVL